MLSKNILLVAIAFAFADQISAAQISIKNVDELSDDNLIEDLAKLLKKLEDIVLEAIDTARDTIHNLLENFKELMKTWLEYVLNHLEEIVLDIEEKLKVLIELATKLDAEGIKCITGKQEEIKNLLTTTRLEIKECAANRTQLVKEALEEALSALRNYAKEIKDIVSEFNKCTGGLQDLACISKVGLKIARKIVQLPPLIAKVATNFEHVAIGAQIEMHKCAGEKLHNAMTVSKQILHEIKQCIDEHSLIENKLP